MKHKTSEIIRWCSFFKQLKARVAFLVNTNQNQKKVAFGKFKSPHMYFSTYNLWKIYTETITFFNKQIDVPLCGQNFLEKFLISDRGRGALSYLLFHQQTFFNLSSASAMKVVAYLRSNYVIIQNNGVFWGWNRS